MSPNPYASPESESPPWRSIWPAWMHSKPYLVASFAANLGFAVFGPHEVIRAIGALGVVAGIVAMTCSVLLWAREVYLRSIKP